MKIKPKTHSATVDLRRNQEYFLLQIYLNINIIYIQSCAFVPLMSYITRLQLKQKYKGNYSTYIQPKGPVTVITTCSYICCYYILQILH